MKRLDWAYLLFLLLPAMTLAAYVWTVTVPGAFAEAERVYGRK